MKKLIFIFAMTVAFASARVAHSEERTALKLSYTLVYVSDVARSVRFYEQAFGIQNRFVHESGQYAEMETGGTTLAFSSDALAGSLVKSGYRPNRPAELPAGMQISFEPQDVEKAYAAALRAGATAVSAPELKPWGWMSAFVRDPDGVLIELAKESSRL